MKRLLILVMCMMIGTIAIAKEKTEYVITYVKSPLNIPSILEKELGLFEKEFAKEGYTFKYPEITAGPEQTQAIAAGSVDVANCVGGISVIIAAANGMDIVGTSMYMRAPETYIIFTKNPDVKSIKDLKGKKVAGPKGTVLHQLLGAALNANGLKLSDVDHISMGIPQALAAMEAGTVDAALLAGPNAAKASEAGAVMLTNGKGLIQSSVIIAVSGKLKKDNPDFATRLTKVHQQALDYWKANPEETYKIVAKETGLTIEQVKEMAKLYDFDPTVSPADIADLEATQQFLLDNKMIPKAIDIKKLMGM